MYVIKEDTPVNLITKSHSATSIPSSKTEVLIIILERPFEKSFIIFF